MKAKEFLSQAFYMKRQIIAKQKRLDWLRDIVPGPTVTFSDELKCPSNPKNSMVENVAIKVVALEEEISADILKLLEVTKEIESTIRAIDSLECRTILEMRYLAFMDWDEITARMGYARSYIFRLHGKALMQIRVS